MGNALCKEPRTGSGSSTGNTFSNLGSVICPNGLGKSKTHPMRKTYFTRSAVDASKKMTSATGWQSVGLHVPDATGRGQQTVIVTPPVAPPRKKRGATLDGRYRSDETLKVKNGFQDVFGRESRRHSYDVPAVTRPVSVPPPRPDVAALPARQTSCFEIDASNDAFSDFSKVPTTAELERQPSTSQIPRVGNRKSDKFFGERLADSLSPEREPPPVPPVDVERKKSTKREKPNPPVTRDDVDKIETFVEQNKTSRVVAVEKQQVEKRNEPLEGGEPEGVPTVEGEDLMKYIDRTVSADNQIGRRAEFLMAMLEDYNDSVRYDGMKPVEEPLIVPKRRKSKHICDDHDHMHNKLHEHERDASSSSAGNIIRTEASIEQAPRKPSRDFSRYKPIDVDPASGSDVEQNSAVRPVRTKQRSKSRENVPSTPPPPPPPRFQKSQSEIQFTTNVTSPPPPDEELPKAHTPRMLKRIISMPATENLGKEPSSRPDTPQRPALTKSSSSGSFSAVDLQRSRISVERFTPEDYVYRSATGADELVKPKSKLTTRKISWKSNEAPTCRTPTPTPEQTSGPSFTIGGTSVVTSRGGPLLCPPDVPRRKRSDASVEQNGTVGDEKDSSPVKDVSVTTTTATTTTTTTDVTTPQFAGDEPEDYNLRQFCLGSFIESSRVLPHHDVVNVLDCVYSATDNQENILEQFQTFLEDAITTELNEPNPVNPNVSKLLEKMSYTSSEDDRQLENVKLTLVGSSRSSSDVDDCFDPEFEKIEKSEIVGELPKIEHTPKHHAGGRRRDSIEYMSDWFAGDSDGSTTMLSTVGNDEKGSEKPPSSKLSTAGQLGNGKRKESIEDVGGWFSNHNVLRPSFGEEFEEPSRRLRRGSDGFLGYDLQRQYPFGKARDRTESQSAEMFEDITKLHEQCNEQPPVVLKHPERKKVLEHRNSSDALLMKVLSKSHHNNEEPKKQISETTSKADESNPLLKVDERRPDASGPAKQPSAGQPEAHEKVLPVSDTVSPADSSEERDHNEHSTLLKFLSKEKLIE